MKTLEQAINDAAKELPTDWILTISVEMGSAWVTLQSPVGGQYSHFHEDTLAEEVEAAVEFAKGCA